MRLSYHPPLCSIPADVYPAHLVEQVQQRAYRRSISTSSPDGGGWGADGGGDGPLARASITKEGRPSLTEAETRAARTSHAADMLLDRHQDVTVLFSDIAGWTSLASTLTPEEAMGLLDRLFQRFDTLSVAHGVYKVETSAFQSPHFDPPPLLACLTRPQSATRT